MKVGFRSNDNDSYLPRFDASELSLGGDKFQRRACIEDMATTITLTQTAQRALIFDMATSTPSIGHPLLLSCG